MHRSHLLAALLAAAAVSGTAASAASADSVAYIRGGNVFLTPGDLSREFQVTSTGGYSAVSQADDGTLLATAGGELRRLDRYGNVLSDIATPASGQGNSGIDAFYGPFDADISPDGRTAAYGYLHSGWNTSGGVADVEQSNGTGYTNSSALTGFTDPGYHYESDWDAPEFIDNSTVLLSNGPGYPSDPISIETVGSTNPQGWFTDPNNLHPLDATISRDHRLIAAVVGPDRQELVVYRDQDGQLLGPVNPCFTYTDSSAHKYESPTFNANGTRLYWSDGSNLETAPIADMGVGCAPGQSDAGSFAGTSPDWGPADVPTSRPGAPGSPRMPYPANSAPAPGKAPGSSSHPIKARLTVAGPVSVKLSRALRHGTLIQITAPGAGKVVLAARFGHATVASGHGHAAGAGRASVRLTFTPAGRRVLARRSQVSLTLTLTEGRRHSTSRMHLTH